MVAGLRFKGRAPLARVGLFTLNARVRITTSEAALIFERAVGKPNPGVECIILWRIGVCLARR